MRFLITAGPTREPIDPVRFVSNPSTGRMGFAVAAAALVAGHEVTVVAGPTTVRRPEGVDVVSVTTTREMFDATLSRFDACDVFVAAAAPCDFRPAQPQSAKLKKDGRAMTLRLAPNPDILLEAGRRKGGRVLIGFAMEVRDARANARRKLREKRLDAIVLNSPAAFGAERSSVTLIRADGREENMEHVTKSELAQTLVRLAEDIGESRTA